MYDDAIADAWWKWSRGVVHAKTLQVDCARWAIEPDNQPLFAVRANYDAQRHGFVITCHDIKPFPTPSWGLMIGDIGNNMRSALDHLTWTIVGRGTKPPAKLNDWQQSQVQFPIYNDRIVFNKKLKDRLPGVSATDRAHVRRAQPYHKGVSQQPFHPLNLLAAVNNDDKHRTIQPVAVIPSGGHHEITEYRDCEGFRAPGRARAWPLQEGAELALIRARKTGPNPHIEVHSTVPSKPTLGNRMLLEDWINLVPLYVARVLAQFSEPPAEIVELLDSLREP